MVLKMLYNWDDMHIFGVAFPKNASSAFRRSPTGDAGRSIPQPSFIFHLIHILPPGSGGTQRAKQQLSLALSLSQSLSATGLEASIRTTGRTARFCHPPPLLRAERRHSELQRDAGGRWRKTKVVNLS